MKKLVLVALMLLVPFTSFALDTMNDADLDEMTAQAGVTIALSNVQITQNATSMAWGDTETNTSWLVLEAQALSNTQSINGTVDFDVVAIADSVYDTTSVAIALDLVITNTGGTCQDILLTETLTTAENPISGTTASSTLGTLYQGAAATQTITGTINIMAH